MDNFENKNVCLLGAVRLKTLKVQGFTLYNSQRPLRGRGFEP